MKQKNALANILIFVYIMIFVFGTFNVLADSGDGVIINEVMSSNGNTILDENGDASDWIELFNNGTVPVNLLGYYITDSSSTLTKWIFPQYILGPKEYLLVFASGNDVSNSTAQLHTNFSIKAGGEEIILTAPDGVTQVSAFPAISLISDQSFGRFPDGSSNLQILPAPSPGANNNVLPPPNPPLFSKDAGFYNSNFSLTITAQPNTTIYYTLDGSVPTTSSLIYTGPIPITNTTGNPNVVSMVNTTSPKWMPPNGLVLKSTIVRAFVMRGNQSSKVTTSTYFLDGNFTMPVISISSDDSVLFDYNTGIYTMGVYWDNASDWTGTNIFHPANYQNKGEEWERPIHLEIFWDDGSRVVNQDIGVRISGQGSRVRPQKSLKLYARSDYGESSIDFPLFPMQNFTSYKRLWVRNSDDDLRATYLRDILANKLMEGTPLATEPYYPSVVFINGEYWGFYPMRDRASQFYLASRYDVDKDEVVILKDNSEIDEGSPGDEQPFLHMTEYVRTHDMKDSSNYEYVQNLMDTKDFARYYSINMYVVNTDWIDRNLVYWRLKTNGTNTSAPFGQDGKWRWIMHDNDWSFGYQPGTSASTNMFNFINSKTWGSVLWNGLSENEEFRDYFVSLSADQLETRFSSDNVISTLDELALGVSPEIQREIDRWKHIPDVETWEQNLENIRGFALQRPAYYREHISDYFGLGGSYDLEVEKIGSGKVSVNSLTLQNYPDSILEFADVPIKLVAIPDGGNKFVGWEGGVSGSNPEIELVLSKNTGITAIFAPINSSIIPGDGTLVWVTRKYPATNVDVHSGDINKFLVEVANPFNVSTQKTWTLDGNIVQNNSLIYNLDVNSGNHILELELKADNDTIVQTWNIEVIEKVNETCFNKVQELSAKCTGGTITSDDMFGGCRIVVCESDLGYVNTLACDKPTETNPTYYEMYRTGYGGEIPNLCIGETCIQFNGYNHANFPVCIDAPIENLTNSTSEVVALQVFSTPAGILYINNTAIGMTPQNFEIAQGTWDIRIVSSGYENYTKTLNLTANMIVNATLVKINTSVNQTDNETDTNETDTNQTIDGYGLFRIDEDGGLDTTFVCKPEGSSDSLVVDWNFGDGTELNDVEEIISHVYSKEGDYFVRCGAWDNVKAEYTIINKLFTVSGTPIGDNQTDNNTTNTTCYSSVQNIPVTCNGGVITTDSFSGCRAVTCSNNNNGDSLRILACEKPDKGIKTFFEMYKQEQVGSSVEICIGDTCIKNNGYDVSATYPICIEGVMEDINDTTTNTTTNTTIDDNVNYTLTITSIPIGDVFINGTNFGITPKTINFPSGKYFVNVSAQGFVSKTSNVNLNTNLTLNFVLEEIQNETNNTQPDVTLSIAPWYPKGNNYIFVCDSNFVPTYYDWVFGDGDKQTSSTRKDVYHTYVNNGSYEVMCTARGGTQEGKATLDVTVG